MLRQATPLLVLIGLSACNRTVVQPTISAPSNLTYALQPSGDPSAPAGLRLTWDPVSDPNLGVYNVYSSASTSGGFDLRGSTTSITFDDAGVPDARYYVTAVTVDGSESGQSNVVTIDQRLQLESPSALTSVSLNGAIHLAWTDNPYLDNPQRFKQYRVYSTSYSLDQNLCGATWVLEGTTVSPTFLVSALQNGVPRCYGVSAESVQGYESLWSPLREDTPRPDARNILLTVDSYDPTYAGFRFYQPSNGALGIVTSSNDLNADFWVYKDGTTGDIYMVPQRAGTSVALYDSLPVDDLTSIDYAPLTGYSASAIQAVPGYGYVFEMSGGDAYARYGAVRVTDVSANYIIIDWAYQTDPGNPELDVHAGQLTSSDTGVTVVRGR